MGCPCKKLNKNDILDGLHTCSTILNAYKNNRYPNSSYVDRITHIYNVLGKLLEMKSCKKCRG